MKKILSMFAVAAALIAGCGEKSNKSVYFVSPEEGSNIAKGSNITLKLDAGPGSFDSVQYLIDTLLLGSKTDTSALNLATAPFDYGTRIITARIYKGGASEEVTSNIVLLPAEAPRKLEYTLVNTYPHDTSSYTQGLEFVDGKFYESDGLHGESSLRIVEPTTGRVLKKTDIDAKYFAEGITVIGDKIVMITYQEGVGFVYDKNTLQKLSEFPYQAGREGWGLCFDGQQILCTDGTNNVYSLNKETYQKERTLEVYSNKGAVSQLNELELIDGKLFANVYQSNIIVVINPTTGVVEAELDLTDLYPEETRNFNADVLNGIAWDAKGRRLFVTGKKWDKLFEIKIK